MNVPEGMDLIGLALKLKPEFAVDDILTVKDKTQEIRTAGAIALVQAVMQNIAYLCEISMEYAERGEREKASALGNLVGLNVIALKVANAVEESDGIKIDVLTPAADKSKLN